MTTQWLTVRKASELIKEADPDGKGVSRRQLLRRLNMWDRRAGGKLLRWRGEPGGVREVNAQVLRQMLRTEPLQVERELAEVHDRIDVLDNRTKALRTKTRKNGKAIEDHEKRLTAHKRSMEHLQKSQRTLLEG